jgi:hypothetical protein
MLDKIWLKKINKMVTKNTFDIILWKFGVVDPEGRYCNAPSRNFFLRYEGIQQGINYSGNEILKMNIIQRTLSIHIGSAAY